MVRLVKLGTGPLLITLVRIGSPYIEALIKVNGTGCIICECSGIQDVDALMLQNIYKTMLK